MSDFFPRGYQSLADACTRVTKFILGSAWVAPLSDLESADLARYARSRSKERRRRSPLASTSAPSAIAALVERNAVVLSQTESAQMELRRMLYSGSLGSWVLHFDGHLEAIPTHEWGTDRFDQVLRTGRLNLTVGGRVLKVHECPVLVRLDELEKACSNLGSNSIAATDEVSEAGALTRHAGGRPERLSWDEIWVEICGLIHDEGVPRTQAELISKIQKWYRVRFDDEPSDSTLKPKVRKLFERLQRDRN